MELVKRNYKILLLIIVIFHVGCTTNSKKVFTISGKLTNYKNEPLPDGIVRLKGKKFEDLYEVKTDSNGKFLLKAPMGQYLGLYAVKDYGEKYLEFWYWDLFLNRNVTKNIKIDTLEVYGLKAWKTFNGLMVYFRPMSLLKYKKLGAKGPNDPIAKNKSIFPSLESSSIKVSVNNLPVKILRLQKVFEVTSKDGRTVEGLLLNTSFPRKFRLEKTHLEICIDIHDEVTDERGMACQDTLNLP